MEYTENLGLKKPSATDFYNVEDFNENMDKIDECMLRVEQGTWTPTFYDGDRNVVNNFTVVQASYTCICNMCFFTCCFSPTSTTTIRSFSLPFAVKSSANVYGIGHAYDAYSKASLTMIASDQVAAFNSEYSTGCVSGWFMLEEYTETFD